MNKNMQILNDKIIKKEIELEKQIATIRLQKYCKDKNFSYSTNNVQTKMMGR
jgi:hypothetical protein